MVRKAAHVIVATVYAEDSCRYEILHADEFTRHGAMNTFSVGRTEGMINIRRGNILKIKHGQPSHANACAPTLPLTT